VGIETGKQVLVIEHRTLLAHVFAAFLAYCFAVFLAYFFLFILLSCTGQLC